MASTDPKASTEQDKPVEQKAEKKPAALGEDDEFEDFPVDDWPEDQTEAAKTGGETKHLWEESWDDDDTSDDFSTQLKFEKLERTRQQLREGGLGEPSKGPEPKGKEKATFDPFTATTEEPSKESKGKGKEKATQDVDMGGN
ncbi:hypothetical protein NM208_g4808 [Fusarium decemcellulare]|uniref:Uncharacterized protein n=1 Tax=Fusarium decemcellulare TaxID=57161 RepID=A0ACC1SJJ8_9HYPO|nr:hypothetical protein NM208_g4808 [Fusarium decemcellulare]